MDDSSTPLPSSNLHQSAIKAALEARWEEALKLNRQIIKLDPCNIDALNRLARAHLELGKYTLAHKYYNLVLKFDSYNPIALKNVKILRSFKKNSVPDRISSDIMASTRVTRISPSMFLQEPGKTKVVNLIKVAEPQKLSLVYCGMSVEMVIKNRRITILDKNGRYLGVLPDDLTHQIIRLIKGGNRFEAIVKSIRVNGVSILIKETFRSKKFKNQPSFLDTQARPLSSSMDLIAPLNDEDGENSESDTEEPEV